MAGARSQRGIILGGGGVTGIAWEVGLLHGLVSAGIALTQADEVIGTSAGAFAGTSLLDERGIGWAFDRQIDCAAGEVTADFPPEVIDTLRRLLTEHADDDVRAGREIGAFACGAKTVEPSARLRVVADRLARATWPSDRLFFTAVDVDTGELHLLSRASGASLTLAAAATGAAPGIWPVVETEGRRWVDGGSISVSNAHLAARFERCLVISPMTMNFSGVSVQQQLEAISGTKSLLIAPDARSVEAIGTNPFDADRRPAIARAGFEQGLELAPAVATLWQCGSSYPD